jgi:hypothetical protein
MARFALPPRRFNRQTRGRPRLKGRGPAFQLHTIKLLGRSETRNPLLTANQRAVRVDRSWFGGLSRPTGEQTVAEATGQASRFLKIYDQYKNAPEMTRQRMYLGTMERLFGGTDKIIVDSKSGVVPYLPLNELRSQAQTPQTGGSK